MQPPERQPPLMRHIEAHLGVITRGWTFRPDGSPAPFQVAQCPVGGIRETDAFVTLGLSKYELRSSSSGRPLRLELLAMIRRTEAVGTLPAILQGVGLELLATGRALLRGEVVGPRGPLWGHSKLQALYASSPVYLDDGFASCDLGDGTKCAFVWLMPITTNESAFVTTHGWEAFEDILATENPDLLVSDRDDVRGICT